jgi:hypothetical protein
MWLNVSIPNFANQKANPNFSGKDFSGKIAERNSLEGFLDELMEISPDIFLGPGQSAYLKLRGVHHFWKLSEFLRNKEENKILHPFYKCLEKINARYGCEFLMCESPAEAAWAQKYRKNSAAPKNTLMKDFLFIMPKNDAFYELLAASPLKEIHLWLQDLVESDEKIATDLHFFCEALEYMGIRNLWELHVSLTQKNFLQSALLRFGSIIKPIHARLNGSEDFHMHPYHPPMYLSAEFSPELERDMSVDVSGEIPTRLLEILCKWERRLESRKSLLSGLEVILESDLVSTTTQPHSPSQAHPLRNQAPKKVLRALFPHPLRDPLFIQQIFMEKWTASLNETFYDGRIAKVTIKSVGLQTAVEHQLHLFDHTEEDVYEEWGLLLGKLYNRGENHSAQVGAFEAQESFIPEESLRFEDWSPGKKFKEISDHPKRPMLMEKNPKELMRDLSREDFMELLAKEEKLRSLELISAPVPMRASSNAPENERLYAQVNDDWVYYDSHKRKVLKHGSF